MKAVFLITEYVPHQVLSIKNFMKKPDAEVIAFHVGRLKIEVPELGTKFQSIQLVSIRRNEILATISRFDPDVVITAGWMVPKYNWVCRKIHKKNEIPVVAMSDTPWYGTWKQKIHSLIAPFYTKKMFTHLWIAGIRQYEYARKLGFSNNQVIFNSLSANIDIFHKVDIEIKRTDYPKNFLYIGRFTNIKGLRNLIKAWDSIKDKKNWTFTLIGSGEMKHELVHNGGFVVKDYMDQENLLVEMQNTGCFVLPSLREPWALVIHEAAAAGLPIICTETCGSAPHFVINHYNGYCINTHSISDLKNHLERIINEPVDNLLYMSKNSRYLSQRITPDIHTASLLQVLNR